MARVIELQAAQFFELSIIITLWSARGGGQRGDTSSGQMSSAHRRDLLRYDPRRASPHTAACSRRVRTHACDTRTQTRSACESSSLDPEPAEHDLVMPLRPASKEHD